MVAIAPTPPTQPASSNRNPQQHDDNQLNTALEITQQPPETWYKDQYGRKATFELKVQRTAEVCAQCSEQRILSVQLLYESGKTVEKQEILHVMSGQCLDKNRQSTLAVRIAEVSKNHLNQRFRVEIAVPRCLGGCDYKVSVVSDPVLVLSKKKKRAVKQNAKTEVSPAKVKKPKRASAQDTTRRDMSSDSPDSLESSTSRFTSNVTAAIAEMEGAIPPRTSELMAPFTPDTPNLCLWANAAFDLLHKLQWQRVPASPTEKLGANLDEILAHAMAKAYKCPSCQETYGQVPTHRDDCDLKLLLEQGHTVGPAAGSDNKLATRYSSHLSTEKHFEWSERYTGADITSKIQASSYNLSQDQLQSTGPGNGPAHTKGFDPASLTLNINCWKDYASLSKLLYSTSYVDAKSPHAAAATALSPTLQWKGVLPPLGTLSAGFPILPSNAKKSTVKHAAFQHSPGSQRFSALLSATKDMSPDAADLFRESEAALHPDGNILNSFDSMGLSDIIRSNLDDIPGNNFRLTPLSSSLSALLSLDQSNVEVGVQIIMSSDFRSCGFPALDASFTLIGFYQILMATHDSPAELRFVPHVFPLPEEMRQELKDTIAEWRQDSAVCHRRVSCEADAEDSLNHLKSSVLHVITQ